MTYCFELSMATIIFLAFVAGSTWALLVMIWVDNTFKKSQKPIDYDGTNGKGYQPRPTPPKAE